MAAYLEDRTLTLSVRDLVEFLLRSGDIDNRISLDARNEAMLAGSRVHRKIQKSRGEAYEAEVPLAYSEKAGEFTVVCEGRADGIFQKDGVTFIEEIKGIYGDVTRLAEPKPVHLAQALCYARFLTASEDLPKAGIRMTYCDLDTEATRHYEYEKTAEELEAWYTGLMEQLLPWISLLYEEKQRRNQSVTGLPFPYPWRPGQKEMAAAVYRTIRDGRRIFVQAPTGIGKTLSTVYPAVIAVGQGMADRIFYLTAKNTTNAAAEEAFRVLREQGLYFRTVVLGAKERICPFPEADCNPESCERARGHFDRVNAAIDELLRNESAFGRKVLLDAAEKYRICPYELSLDLTDFSDAVIGDYNYAFDPEAKLGRFFGPARRKERIIFLIDEAHNLTGRAREMYSADLSRSELAPVAKILSSLRKKGSRKSGTEKKIEALRQVLREMRDQTEENELPADLDPLIAAADSLDESLQRFLDDHREFEGRDDVLEFSFRLRKFTDTAAVMDENYRNYAVRGENGDYGVRLFCVNPSVRLSECLEGAAGAVFFSATLLPLGYYRELLSGDGENYGIMIPSPFPRENRKIFIAKDVTSSYRSRSGEQYQRIAGYIREMALARKGCYMVFFPSYPFMEKVAEIFSSENPPFDILVQQSGMDSASREEFLAEFDGTRDRTLVGFCVLGGIFSEGIDLKQDRLIGVAVVGTGLSAPTAEQKILREFYEDHGRDGFRFAFQIPGMTRVMQAAGRVIRTREDKGVILLLDSRMTRRTEKSMFPEEWSDAEEVLLPDFSRKIREFWDGVDNS